MSSIYNVVEFRFGKLCIVKEYLASEEPQNYDYIEYNRHHDEILFMDSYGKQIHSVKCKE